MSTTNEHGLIGLTVQYRMSAIDAGNVADQRRERGGIGNTPHEGEVVPMIVVEAWSEGCVNGQVILDGNDSLWVTSVNRGDQPGEWDFR